MSVYTRTGDRGRTRMGDGCLLSKFHLRVDCLGAVDELNALIGMAAAHVTSGAEAERLKAVQGDLFAVGASLSRAGARPAGGKDRRHFDGDRVGWLERQIDHLESELPVSGSFVLPGGTDGACWLHLARTVCRRAERRFWELAAREDTEEGIGTYLNRLADLLFVMARSANRNGHDDVVWDPDSSSRQDA